MFSSVRLNACASRTPVISSWRLAVTPPVVSRAVRKAALRPAGEGGGGEEHRRDDQVAGQRELPLEQEHRDHDADQAEHRAQQLGDALADELIDRVDIIGGAADQVADRAAVEESQREMLELIEQPCPERGQNPLADRGR